MESLEYDRESISCYTYKLNNSYNKISCSIEQNLILVDDVA